MKKEILIVKNATGEGPGLLEEVLNDHNITYKITDLDRGEEFPAVENFGAVVVLGGPDSANDETPKMKSELAGIRWAIDAGIPFLGICLGLQAMVKACGGSVIKSNVKEVGFVAPDGKNYTVELTVEGITDPLFEGLVPSLNVFHLHGETVELADNMILLASGRFCRNQIVKIGRQAYGIQCHFELTQEMLENWINEDPELLKLDKAQLRRKLSESLPEYTQTGRRLFSNFLKIAGLS